jgi:hypothetical protein
VGAVASGRWLCDAPSCDGGRLLHDLWHDLFIGVAGAAAALTGLLFEALVIAILGLVPGQSSVALGVELLSLGLGAWLFATGVYTVRRPAVGSYRAPIVVGVVTSQLATLPVVAAGASLVAQRGGGLYWLVPGIVLLLGVGVINAWVLLIEILR